MATIRMSQADLIRDAALALAKVRQGDEVIIEEDHREVAVIKRAEQARRTISEAIADLEARGSTAAMDEEFARDIEAGVNAQREAWNPPSWD